jgi:hypothetical protein
VRRGGKRRAFLDRLVHEEQAFGERLPGRLVERPARELSDAVLREVAIALVAQVLAADADRGESRREQPVQMKVVERGEQFAVREIADPTEDHERDRFGHDWRRLPDRETIEERFSHRAS